MLDAKDRVCLKCNKTFASKGPYNRICPDCASSNHKLIQKHSIHEATKPHSNGPPPKRSSYED